VAHRRIVTEEGWGRMIFNSPERVTALTPKWEGPRLADGRPDVAGSILERMKAVTNDEVWGVIEKRHGYNYNFEGNWLNLHPELVLVGRVVTAQFVPLRPDLNDVVQSIGASEGRSGGQNTWVIDQLGKDDVLVVDLFGKVHDGTFIGDNLATATRRRTGTGIVIDGGIRDFARVNELADFAVFCRGTDPSAIAEVTLVGVNIPIRIGHATVLPGDVVLGTQEGVSFVPPHLAEEVVDIAEDVAQRDVFGKWSLAEGIYTSGEIDVPTWADHIEEHYKTWTGEQGLGYAPKRPR
jgi:regulator of RNase E activity RraA